MKKQRKQLIIMAIFLLFLLVAYFALEVYNEKQEENENKENTVIITDYEYDDIVAFSYQYSDETYHFTKTDETWKFDTNPEFDVDESLVEEMLETACSLVAIDYYDAYESLDNYGLDTPQQVVNLTFSDGETASIQLGNYNDIVGYYYLMIEEDSNLYMVDGTILDTFEVSYTSLEYIEEETEDLTEE